MAKVAGIEALTGGLDANTKKALVRIFEYVLKNLRLGRPGSKAPSENLRAVFLEGTTASVANQEFSLEHGLEQAPYLIVPVLDASAVGQRLVPLTVSRASDARRIYLKSSETSAPFSVFVEG